MRRVARQNSELCAKAHDLQTQQALYRMVPRKLVRDGETSRRSGAADDIFRNGWASAGKAAFEMLQRRGQWCCSILGRCQNRPKSCTRISILPGESGDLAMSPATPKGEYGCSFWATPLLLLSRIATVFQVDCPPLDKIHQKALD